MCAAKPEENSTDSDGPVEFELPLSFLPLLLGLGGGSLLPLLTAGRQQKADRVKRSALKEKYGQDIGRFRETTGNVAAIDFGTTFCSLAYTTGSEEQSVANIKLNEVYSRVPTAILLFQKQYHLSDDSDDPIPKSMAYEVKAFGYQAQEEHRKLRSHDRSKCLYFERFKMNLQQDKGVNRNMAIKASNGTECYLVEVIAFILCYLKEVLQKHLAQPVAGNDTKQLTTDDFDWVITVPAIWKSRGKLMMREAAYMAGLCSNENTIDCFIKVGRGMPRPKENNPDRLSLALEPEAAAIYCQTLHLQNVQPHCNISGSLRSNRYVVIDIGGGTVDITAHRHEQGKGIEVISEPIGNDCGGMKVNNEFSKLLQKIFQDESSDPNDTIGFPRYLQTDNDPSTLALRHAVINSLLHKEFELEKVSFGSNAKGTEPLNQADEQSEAEKEVNVKIPCELVDFYGLDKIEEGVEALQDDRIQLDEDVLYIKYSKMREIFQPAVDGILSCIASLLERLQGEIDTIYLVGGFGGCTYIYQKISSLNRNSFEENNIRIIVPKDHSLAVSQGAVKYRLNPDIIHSRVMDASYGTDICAPYFRAHHNPKYFVGIDSRGIPRRRDVFLYYVEKGEVISSDEVVTGELMPLSDAATEMKIDLYSTYDKDVEYIKDEDEKPISSVRKIGEIQVDIPNEDGLPRERRAVEMTMDFSHTEIQVRARYSVNNTEVKATVDFLTDHAK